MKSIIKKILPYSVKAKLASLHAKMGGGKTVVDSGDNNHLEIGENCSFYGLVISFRGNNNTLRIGDNCNLRNANIQLIDDDNTVIIESGNEWGNNISIVAEEGTTIQIGKKCQVAKGVIFRSSDGHSILSEGTRINHALDIKVGDRCWFGENAVVLKGCDLGSNCVIGTYSIVTKGKYESNAVYVGNPVRKVKENISWIVPRI